MSMTDNIGGTMIQTEPDYGEPQFNYSEETIGSWLVAFQSTVYESWKWEATQNDGDVYWQLESQVSGLESYDEAKAHCTAMLESLTPDGFLPKSYVSTEDASREIHRLENGRWICLLDGVIGEHNFATADLAAAAHKWESYGDEELVE